MVTHGADMDGVTSRMKVDNHFFTVSKILKSGVIPTRYLKETAFDL